MTLKERIIKFSSLIMLIISFFIGHFGLAHANDIQAPQASALQELLDSVEGEAEEPPRIFKTSEGYLRFLGAPPSTYFPVDPNSRATPQKAANAFLSKNSNLFVNDSPHVRFETVRVKTCGTRTYLRCQQTYSGIKVKSAEMVVQLNESGGITAVISDIMSDTVVLDSGEFSLNPTNNPVTAQDKAIEWISKQHENLTFEVSPATLKIFSPSVVGSTGPTQLVWQTEVGHLGQKPIRELVLVNAHSGEIALHYSLIHDAKEREIYDMQQGGALVRVEGDPPTGIADVDNAYDYLGATYDFYNTEHNRDSIDDNGMTLIARVRYDFCNAYWMGSYMKFGNVLAFDDIVAHEYTHGVTDYESDLDYLNESGAIDESFCDMWGEWVDQGYTNGNDTDTSGVKWLLGEDVVCTGGALRDMADPPQCSTWYGGPMPDRYNSTNWYDGLEDNGGVHHNSSVGNKLCYLLTDGSGDEPDGKFNGHTVEAMDIPKTADLFYECQTNLLTSGSAYYDLYFCLIQAAINLGMTQEERDNIEQGCRAVEIVPNLIMGWWKLDETSGVTAPDSSSYDNDGTLADSPRDPAWMEDWVRGWCLDFDADAEAQDYVYLSPISALTKDDVTIAAWIKADDLPDGGHSIIQQYDNPYGYSLYVDGVDDKPALWLNSYHAISTEAISTGEWYHLAGTYDGYKLKIFVDGFDKGTQNLWGQKGISHDSYIGWKFDGLIDDVRVYNYAMNQAQIWETMSTSEFSIEDSSCEKMAWFDDLGNLFLKGSLSTEVNPIEENQSLDEFVVKHANGDILALIDTTEGNMYIKGKAYPEQTFIHIENFIVRGLDKGAYIDDSGDLYLIGKVYQANP
jgi:Zn-dependent metalloprotease